MTKFFNYDWKIDLLMADASLSIHKATRQIFRDEYIHEMCSAHVWRNMEKQITSHVCTNRISETIRKP